LAHLPAEPTGASAAGSGGNSDALHDIQFATEHWQRNTWASDSIPLLDTFDFSPLRADSGYWFLICGDHAVESAVFVSYAAGFARLLGLPTQPVPDTPCIEQLPISYRGMFSAGYSRAGVASSPVTLDGTFRFETRVELYRAVFMPIMLQPNWSKQIFGSFNRRELGAV